MRVLLLPAFVLTLAGSAAAQSGAVTGVALGYNIAKGNLVRAAEQMPEADYSFQATKDVRTFGQLVGHVADANFMICSTASGEANPTAGNLEKTLTAKTDLVKALKDSFTFCDKAYQIADSKALEEVTLFGSLKTNRVGALAFNAAHDMEHYGNIVTYMRLKGMVPPSSQPRN
jgi:uncharacterized damage-inducible protein DinB